jgi:hypothetical protein
MRRFARCILPLGSVASLLLGVAAGVLWVQTQSYPQGWMWLGWNPAPSGRHGVPWKRLLISSHGRLYYISTREMSGQASPFHKIEGYAAAMALTVATRPPVLATGDVAQQFLGFEHHLRRGYPSFTRLGTGPPTDLTDTYAIPHWAILLTTLPMPAAWIARRSRSRRFLATGRCVACGYDLRATPDRCPECGTPVLARGGALS